MRFGSIGIALLLLLAAGESYAQNFTLHKGEHLCIIGNTLAERMQHVGWLETLLHARFPQHELVVRNLGYSGDEVDQNKRLRSMSFGTPDEWLSASGGIPQPNKLNAPTKVPQNRFEKTNTKADVIFLFFGYNESFAGAEGLEAFKATLDGYLKHLLAQKYNGKSAPRLVVFSPLAHEDLRNPNLTNGSENNARLKLYTAAMAEVAKANQQTFVDLFSPTLESYKTAAKPLTINGVHLNEHGDEVVARIIDKALFGGPVNIGNPALETLRTAVNEKNFFWYNRYRVTDGYSTYGDRAFLKFTDGQSNYEVGQRELEVLDVLTSNRDGRIWQIAANLGNSQFKLPAAEDKNLPPFVPVVTNKPGKLEGGAHFFETGEDAIKQMTVHKGMKVNLFADEKQFPDLINPVQMAVDPKGRIWVAAWPTYPHWKPTEAMNDKLLILEDTNGDGRADKCIPFADDLHNPTGFEFWGGGVIVAMAPDLIFLKDTDGDDRADVRIRLLHGLDTADTHHTANSFTLDPGGALYFQEGTFHHSQVETAWKGAMRVANGAVFRYEPRAQKFDVYVSYGFANPHGHVFDRWGQDIVVDGTGAVPYHGTLFSGHLDFPNKHGGTPTVYKQRTRPCPGMEYLSSKHFPDEMQGNLLVGNVIGFQGILRYKVSDKESSFTAEEQEPIVSSSDPNFRPADLEIGADGALYFCDWQNPIIGHMQHNLRDPSRDRLHGRVYRVTYEGRALSPSPKIAGEPVEKLLAALKSTEDRVRYRARIELSSRETKDVIAATERWLGTLDKSHPNFEHQQLEALWVHQHHNVVNNGLLEKVLTSPDFRARAAGVKVLCYWRDRVSNTLDLLRKAAGDEHPRVRLEAVRAASFLPTADAAEVPIIAQDVGSDMYIDYVTKETMRTLQPLLDKLKSEGKKPNFVTAAGARFTLKSLNNEQLLLEPRTAGVYYEILLRPGMQDQQRRDAIRGLSMLENKSELRVVMDAIQNLDKKAGAADTSLIFDLIRQLTGRGPTELLAARAELEKLATSASQPVLRQVGYVALMNVDGNADKAWSLATSEPKKLIDFVNAIPLISNPTLKAGLYAQIEPLLKGLPANLANSAHSKGTFGRYVRIELPLRGTLTLAEVEIYSGGRNVALQGKASQSSTSHGGEAKRAIDGNKSPIFADGGQTHSAEGELKPWWEVDLGEELPIDAVVIFNRAENLGNRLNGYILTVLDGKRSEAFKTSTATAPEVSQRFELGGGGPESLVRHAAMNALTQIRGQETKTFDLLAKFVREDDAERIHAVRALQRLPAGSWSKEAAPTLISVLTAAVKKIPTAERTGPTALDMLEFADSLSSLLPADAAKKVRTELAELGVKVIRINTVFERMAYDKEVIAVKAGKPVEFVLDNVDLMPHNFVIIQPGSLEEIGLLSETLAQQPAHAERQFVPPSPKVLAASRLLQPRDSQRISFNVPTTPGVYPYVCTFPGHWRRMYGALYVVADLDEYLANPEPYLAASKIAPVDAMLKSHRPRTEWKFEDLASEVAMLKEGRSHAHGKQLFQIASCIGCHKLEGQGNEFGPDLTKLDPKYQQVDFLKHILEPSAKIDDKFKSEIIVTDAGATVTGLVVKETPDEIQLVVNPLAKTEPVVLKKTNIEARKKSDVSLMPKGLLDKLTRDEILDLLAYVLAKGEKNNPLFKGGNHGH